MARSSKPPVIAELIGKERLRAWANGPLLHTGEQSIVVATDRAFYATGLCPRTPWMRVRRAGWDDGLLEIAVDAADSDRVVRHRIRVDEPGVVPDVIHERVNASIAFRSRLEVAGGPGVEIIARSEPGGSVVRWQVICDEGLDPNDPELQLIIQARVDELVDITGLPDEGDRAGQLTISVGRVSEPTDAATR